MGNKRKAGGKSFGRHGSQEPDPVGTKLNIQSWEDVADSEDEFHIGRDKILLEEEPSRKRQRLQEEKDAFLEPSEEEVLGIPDDESDYDSESEEGYSEEEDEEARKSESRKQSKSQLRKDADSGSGTEDEEDKDEGWGASKRDYYNADALETEADALEEEQEALRLQKKQLQDMTEADYGFDENEWLDSGKGDDPEDQDGIFQEILPDLDIAEDIAPQERSRILQTRYPEFSPLAEEFLSLQSQHEDLTLAENAAKAVLSRKKRDALPERTIASIKRSALGGYLAALAMYFAILSSGSQSLKKKSSAMPPTELRDHPIMDTLVQCRGLWERVKDVPLPDVADLVDDGTVHDEGVEDYGASVTRPSGTETVPKKRSRKSRAEKRAAKAKAELDAQREDEARRLELRLAKLDDRIMLQSVKSSLLEPTSLKDEDENSDFGEEAALTVEEAAEKARRKKGLRFYTSQIAQKSNKRSAAGRGAGGDDDIPYRERLKDRQARLNAEAEARGKKRKGDQSEVLGGDSDDDDVRAAKELRDDEDEVYYNFVASNAKTKKDAKTAKTAAIREAAAQGALVREIEEVGEDGKRGITYAIEKNKGLTPRRPKDVRNPRVKKRKKFEEKKKKLGSIRPVYKGGEGRGGYGGELTGIKTGLIKSRKL